MVKMSVPHAHVEIYKTTSVNQYFCRMETSDTTGNNLNRYLTIAAIVTNALIVVGVGHGIGVLGIFEVLAPFWIFEVEFSLTGTYDERFGSASILGFFGQVFLILCLFAYPNNTNKKLTLGIIGSILLLFSYFILSYEFNDEPSNLALKTGIPFLILDSILLVAFIKSINKN